MSDKEERGGTHTAVEEKKGVTGKSVALYTALAVLSLLVIALGYLLYQTLSEKNSPPEPEIVSCRAVCYTPLGEPIIVSAPQGEALTLPEGPAIEHYRFIGWADEKGRTLDSDRVTLYHDEAFSAQYAIAFRSESGETRHEPYLPLDEGGLFRPHAALTRAEAAELLYSILDSDAVGSGSFADVAPEDNFFAAAATLKDLGVLSGSRFHPDEEITHAEFFEMLACFYPRCVKNYAFSLIERSDPCYPAFCLAASEAWIDNAAIDPNGVLTRAEAAHVFNLLRGRAPIAETDTAKVGTILDVSFRDRYFWDIAEACIPHESEQSAEGERWRSSTAQPIREEGFFFIGTELHCADAEGSPLVNESCGNFNFGPDGVITTGMPELDALVQEKLRQLVDPATMAPELMLRKVYDYVTYHSSYLRGSTHEIGATGWEAEAAYEMLHDGRSNCYGYAGTFAVLARALGFDAISYSGTIGVGKQPHGWVEISFDGIPYVFDTNIECEEHIYQHKNTCMYKLPPERYAGWRYVKEAPETK